MTGLPYCLAADIGGTKTLLRLAVPGAADAPAYEVTVPTAHYSGLAALVADFLRDRPHPAAACFAVAAPVTGGRLNLTNLAFVIDADEIRERLGIARVSVVNDFIAVAHGIAALGGGDLLSLQEGVAEPGGARVVLGAGTGLGMACLLPAESGERVLPSEGGHADFAPADEEQVALWRFLAARYGHVSWERVVSGAGLGAIYRFLGGQDEDPAAVTAAAEAGEARAAHALRLFCRLYGAVAGNVALTFWATGGVYIAGGIAPRILSRLQEGAFLAAFLDKGRFRTSLARMPVRVVLEPRVGLLGAMRVAARMLSPRSST